MATKLKTLFLSDVHIGTNEPWYWYQAKYHEPYLLAMLKYACSSKAGIDDIVLLGDFVDLWLVPPQEKPRTFADIVAANPNVFEQLTKCAQTKKVHYITGNHDMSVLEDDVKAISQNIVYGKTNYVFGHKNGHAEHGHDYSLFNHKDVKGYGGMYPLGYFITRLVALYLQQKIKASKKYENAAQIPGHGHPMAVAMKQWKREDLYACLKGEQILSEKAIVLLLRMINNLLDTEKYDGSLKFVMPADAECDPVSASDVINKYSNLVEHFNNSIGGKKVSRAAKFLLKLNSTLMGAVAADLALWLIDYGPAGLAAGIIDYKENLFPGAFISREKNKKPVVLMGHTHKAAAKQFDGPRPTDILYLNTDCVCHVVDKKGCAPARCVIVEESKWDLVKVKVGYIYTGTICKWSTPNSMGMGKKHKIHV